jgi:hypothetical protein
MLLTYSTTRNTLYFYEVGLTTVSGNESDVSPQIHGILNERSGLRFTGDGLTEFGKTPSLENIEQDEEVAVEFWFKHNGDSDEDAVLVGNKATLGNNGYALHLVGQGEEVRVGFSPTKFSSNCDSEPLPVELARFEATTDGDAIQLSWETTSETGNAGFRIQRRAGEGANGREGVWTTVGSVEGSGTTSQAQSYRFTDGDLPYEANALTYRLKQVDTDGTAHLSKTVTVERGVQELELLGTYPNPARQQATVRYALPEKQDATIRLYDVLGRQVRTLVSGEQEGRHEQRLDTSRLPSGVYFLWLRAGGETRTQKLTITR